MVWTRNAVRRLSERFGRRPEEICSACVDVVRKAGEVLGFYHVICHRLDMVLVVDGRFVITVKPYKKRGPSGT
jgi:hypothetical protein